MERMVNKTYSGLPAFLVENGGLNSGFMVPQYTAAGLINLNKGLSWPNSVDSIPLCAGQEDHVSMGTNSALTAYQVVENTQYVLAIELLIAAQALEFAGQKRPSPAVQKLLAQIRRQVPKLEQDTALAPAIEWLRLRVRDGSLLQTVEAETGMLA